MGVWDSLLNRKKIKNENGELRRNDVCWCGSGKKYKKCHLDTDENKRRFRAGTRPKKHGI